MIKTYLDKQGNKKYIVKVYLGIDPLTGKQRHTTRRNIATLKEAKKIERRLKVDADEKGFEEKIERMKFKDVSEMWFDNYKNTVKGKTVYNETLFINKHILPLFGDMYVDKITVTICQRIVNDWSKQYQHVNAFISTISRILDYARRLKLIKENPMKDIIKPKKRQDYDAPQHENFYDKDELQHFLSLVKSLNDNKLYIMFRLLTYTGMRKGELLGLQWRDIDEINNTISINRTLSLSEHGKPILQTPKTKKSTRIISVDIETMQYLKEWRQYQKITMLKLGYNTNSPTQLLFSNHDNNTMNHGALNNKLNRIIKKFNLKRITVHGFRHSHCSLLFESGASIKQVQDRLGHSNVKTTMDIYNHVTKKQRDEIGELFANFLAL